MNIHHPEQPQFSSLEDCIEALIRSESKYWRDIAIRDLASGTAQAVRTHLSKRRVAMITARDIERMTSGLKGTNDREETILDAVEYFLNNH